MGADGWIKIYDYNKLKELVPKIDEFLSNHCGHLYKRVIFGNTVVTMYADTEWQEPTCIVCGEYGYCNKHYQEVNTLDKIALIDKWEVWT